MPDLLRFNNPREVAIFTALKVPPSVLRPADRCECGEPCAPGETICARCAGEARCKSLRGELVAGVDRDAVVSRRILLAMAAGLLIGFAIAAAVL